MEQLLLWIGRAAGALGALMTVLAFGARAAGTWQLAGVHIGTLLQGGTALMVLGVLCYAALLAERRRP